MEYYRFSGQALGRSGQCLECLLRRGLSDRFAKYGQAANRHCRGVGWFTDAPGYNLLKDFRMLEEGIRGL